VTLNKVTSPSAAKSAGAGAGTRNRNYRTEGKKEAKEKTLRMNISLTSSLFDSSF
jgi:hypothetical protein